MTGLTRNDTSRRRQSTEPTLLTIVLEPSHLTKIGSNNTSAQLQLVLRTKYFLPTVRQIICQVYWSFIASYLLSICLYSPEVCFSHENVKRANVTIYIHGYLQMIETNPRARLNGTLIHIFPFEVDLLESNTISNIFPFKHSPPGSSYNILSENTRVGGG